MAALTQARLKELLIYDRRTGIFTWRIDWHARKKGQVAGSSKDGKYWRIGIDWKMHSAHRLAWLYVTGVWPSVLIDHRDGIGTNNKFSNLREATHAQNSQNTGKTAGITRHRNKWQAQIRSNGTSLYLGLFTTCDEARAAHFAAKSKLHAFQPVPRC